MLNTILSVQQPKNIISVTTNSFRHLSPQALEALQTLDQIRNQKCLNNQKIVRRVSSQYYQPPPLSVFGGGRSASVFTSSPIKMVAIPENSQLTSMCTSFVQQQLVKGSGIPQISGRKPSVNTDRMISHQNTLGEPTPFFRDTISSDRNRLNQTSLSNYLAKHQLQNQLKTHTQSSNNNCTERLNELISFKQQVQNDVLIETIISKFDSPLHKDSFKKFSPLNRGTPITTPIVNNTLTSNTKLNTIQNSPIKNDDQLDSCLRNNEDRIKILYGGSQTTKENKSPSADLVKKKKMILNQILALDNQIKIMQDEETKQKLDPQHKKKPSSSNQKSEVLYKQASERQESLKKVYEQNAEQKIIQEMQECTFVPKINNNQQITSTFQERMSNWVKQKSSKILLKQEISQEEIMRQCTFSPVANSTAKQISASGVYQRNQVWQQRLNMKKQKLKCQNSMLQLNTSNKSQNNKSQNKVSQQKAKRYHIDFSKLLKPNNIVQDQKPLFSDKVKQKHLTTEIATTISPRKKRLNSSNQVENVDNKYLQLCQIAQKMKCKFS